MATLKITAETATYAFDAHLEAVPEVIDEMLDNAGMLVTDAWKAQAAAKRHTDTWYMYDHTEARYGLKQSDQYRCIKIYPRGNDSVKPPKKYLYGAGGEKRQVTNAVKAFLLNYGTVYKGKTRIHGDHWVEQAREWSDPRAMTAMESIWKKFCEKF